MRYYSILRPVSIGTYPREGAREIVNFDRREYVPEIGREAWGYIEYSYSLTEQEMSDYDLVPAAPEKSSQAARIADIKRLQIPALNANPFGDDAEAEEFDRQLQAVETAWASIYEAVASGKSRIAYWDLYHCPRNHSFMRYALHRSTKKPGYLQVSVMEIRRGEMIPTSDHQYSNAKDFLRDTPRDVVVHLK